MRPLQNRVAPDGVIQAVGARGLLMGNRGGALHVATQQLGNARWRSKRWIACSLVFKGRHREVMAHRRYTELFFLDEATALAAGHRPCAECRRNDFLRFRALWPEVDADAAMIDTTLHAARLVAGTREQRTTAQHVEDLPPGAMFRVPGRTERAFLRDERSMRAWRFDGYGDAEGLPKGRVVVLTPAPTVAVLAAGYRPFLHPSALGDAD